MPTQGLYDSVAGIRTQKELMDGVKKVWASKWKDLSFWARHDYKIGHEKIQPNIIIQEVMPVDYTFTLYTGNLEKNSKDKMTIQLSPGVDCGFAGDPYIFEYDRTANSQSYPAMRTMMATKNRMKNISKVLMNDPYREKYDSVDYSKDPLNCSKKEYSSLIEKIAKIAERIEEEVPTEIMEKNSKGKWVKVKKSVPQDIEGGVKFVRKNGKMVPEIYIWQTRNIFYPDETAKKQ